MDVVFDNTPTRVSSMGHRHIYARVNRSDCYVHRCPTDSAWRRHRPPESFGHCQLEQSAGDFRRFASAIHQVACDV